MNKLLRYAVAAFAIACFMLAAGCKTQRATLKKPLNEHGFDYLYHQMLKNQVGFDYLSAKLDITYTQQKNRTELNGQLRIRQDSLVWISFSPALGIEAARIMLTNDSVKFINRLNKTYFNGKYALIDSLLNTTIDYSILQSMLLGNDLTTYDVNKFRTSIDDGMYKITILERRKLRKYLRRGENTAKVLVQQIWLDPNTYRIRRIDIKELGKDNNKLQFFYDDFETVDGQLMPTRMRIEVTSQKPILIEVTYSKIVLNKPQKYPFNIPRKYEPFL